MELNKYIDSISVRISEIHTQLIKDEEVINPIVFKDLYLGNIAGPKMLCEVFQEGVDQYLEKMDIGDVCKCTFLRWERCVKYLSEFLQQREGRHILSHRGVQTTEEWRDGKKKRAMERTLRLPCRRASLEI